ncbi:MAG: T9SS type A sorting domain-containing protein [Saprospiraceae bacterium]|nr:T9SS type A sorting domain-containing protein [Saprospiraceae bacterium]MCF8251075.1 T9SS type A sorting domain-containing protein [Saprospiraceae bacterium]MCF8280360.1 T9SS type A sorting domain-containing protein [Bacteroidales bacterium]MCF8312869.1 T9SS type A sorting domain-containing protein [Saprospiraceae bacterium]MCF8441334.1 T9SS type A sorting domain-containing protein [Saprospiraceae bacterium]
MKKIFALLTLSCLFQITLRSQELRGTVLSERGFAAAKVTVEFKDKSNQVVTNPDGTFKIIASKLPDTLLFSGAGFEPYKVVITEKNLADPKFEVVLLEKRAELAMGLRNKATVDDIYVVGALDIPIKKMDDVAYDTVIVFDPETYEEMITVTRKSDLGYAPVPPPPPPTSDKKAERFMATSDYSAHSLSTVAITSKRSRETPASNSVINGKTFVTTDTLSLPAAISPKSRLLTAGEVNDFLKWEMWKDLSEAEFKSFSEHWGIVPKERFCVQLANKSGDAIVGEPVSLLDKKSGKTIWQALTDNTGKAELWANIFPGENQQEFVIKGAGFEVKKPVAFHNGINQVEVKTACQTSNVVEIAFVVDATGSMADELEFLKLELEDVIRSTFDQHADLDLRAASVFYRDLGEEYVTRHIDFNDDLLKVLNFIKLQSAAGGGDEPEAVDSALSVALHQLTWSQTARTKILFLLSDAAPHAEAKADMKKLMEKAAAMGVRIIPLACSGTNKNYEYLQRSMALATNGTYACLTNHSGVGGNHEEPTTDSYKVELLNTLLQRLIEQSVFVPECNENDQPLPLDKMPVAFQPNNPAGLKSFPNPTSGNVTVELNGEMEAVYLTDFTGKILERLAVEKTVHQLSLGGYPSGVYFLAYFTKDKKQGTERVVLQRG